MEIKLYKIFISIYYILDMKGAGPCILKN